MNDQYCSVINENEYIFVFRNVMPLAEQSCCKVWKHQVPVGHHEVSGPAGRWNCKVCWSWTLAGLFSSSCYRRSEENGSEGSESSPEQLSFCPLLCTLLFKYKMHHFHAVGWLASLLHYDRCKPLLRLFCEVAVHHSERGKKDQVWEKVWSNIELWLKYSICLLLVEGSQYTIYTC